MEDSRVQRIFELRRLIALLQTEERGLITIAASPMQTEEFKRQAQEDLLEIRRKIARLAQILEAVESEQDVGSEPGKHGGPPPPPK